MQSCLKDLGIEKINAGVFAGEWRSHGPVIERFSPIDGKLIGLVREATAEDYERAVGRAQEAFLKWQQVPAPVRGETVRCLGNALREAKPALARLVTIETGKILTEALGEVQEMIDVCDFAVGLSRQLYGLTIQSERPRHRLMEQWHPLGLVGVITAFNFPVAVWSWNSVLAAVCGDIELLPVATAAADLVWSNLALQWVNDPRHAFAELHRVLKPGGLLMFSSFGPDTLKELRAAFRGADERTHVHRFIDMHDVGDMLLAAGFADPVMDMEYLTLTYDAVRDLMRDLKALGAHNVTRGRPAGLSGKSVLATAARNYEAFRRDG